MMDTGFSLKTASRTVRNVAAGKGIKTGRWEPVNAGTAIDDLPDDAVVAKVWNSRKSVDVLAGDIRYILEYSS